MIVLGAMIPRKTVMLSANKLTLVNTNYYEYFDSYALMHNVYLKYNPLCYNHFMYDYSDLNPYFFKNIFVLYLHLD